MYVFLHVYGLRLFQTVVDAIKVLIKVWQLSVCIVIIHMRLMNGSQSSGSTSIEDDISSDGVRPDFCNVQHICVLASCLLLSLTFLFRWVFYWLQVWGDAYRQICWEQVAGLAFSHCKHILSLWLNCSFANVIKGSTLVPLSGHSKVEFLVIISRTKVVHEWVVKTYLNAL